MLMDANNRSKWFEYSLFDAWGSPVSSVTVHNSVDNLVTFGRFSNRYDLNEGIPGDIRSVCISDAALGQIKAVLVNRDLYILEKIEHPVVLDGYIQRFYFSDGEYVNDLQTDNLHCLKENSRKYPCARLLIRTLEEIASILIPEGVDAKCFLLECE